MGDRAAPGHRRLQPSRDGEAGNPQTVPEGGTEAYGKGRSAAAKALRIPGWTEGQACYTHGSGDAGACLAWSLTGFRRAGVAGSGKQLTAVPTTIDFSELLTRK